MRHDYLLSDVFTAAPLGGNPLAVFPRGERIAPALYPRIARELNLSETVFVLPPDDPRHAARLRIFTPGMELPFAGHPTVGTALALARLGAVALAGERSTIVFEEGVGPVTVTIVAEGGRAARATFTAARVPERGPAGLDRETAAALLSLEPTEVEQGRHAPEAWSCGVPFLVVPLRDREALRRARLDPGVWERALRDSWAPHVYPIVVDPDPAAATVRARMFAPAMGIVEDPATGAAATALAGYLAPRFGPGSGTLAWRIEQGAEMGRPSRIDLELDLTGGAIGAVRVGGEAAELGGGWLELGER